MNTLAIATDGGSNVFLDILGATIPVGSYHIGYLELIGVLIGFAGAVLGMRRSMLTWPVGAIANVILFFVYIGVVFGLQDGRSPAFGQAGRQIFFLILAGYGWWQWSRARADRHADGDAPAVAPRWATTRERIALIGIWGVGTVLVHYAFTKIGYFWPAPDWFLWSDSWIFVGSLIATFAMARAWNEFWLCWIAVDLVGVPTLWKGHYIPTAILYIAYSGFVIYGLIQWIKAGNQARAATGTDERALAPAN